MSMIKNPWLTEEEKEASKPITKELMQSTSEKLLRHPMTKPLQIISHTALRKLKEKYEKDEKFRDAIANQKEAIDDFGTQK